MKIDWGNVQGTVVHMYRRPIVRHALFRFGAREGACAFVRGLLPHVTMADRALHTTPKPLISVGITHSGLEALGVLPAIREALNWAFVKGPNPQALGDVADSPSAEENWWEGQFRTEEVHCIVHMHVSSDDALDSASEAVRALAQETGVSELVPRKDGTVLDGRSLRPRRSLHFGYKDGISHPRIGWDDASRTAEQVDFREFLLGYGDNAKGEAADFVRDGTYGAFRWIYQDVAAFNLFLRTEGPRLSPDLTQEDAEELLAAKLMGRWRDGTPLVLSPDRPDSALAKSNDFGYKDDPHGYRCPFSAHIRVVNPRDEQLDPAVDPNGVPFVVRRGMPYGPVLEGVDDDGQDRGVIGIFLCSDIRSQVYKLTRWINSNDFSPVYDADRHVQDALVANRAFPEAVKEFSIPREEGEDGSVTLLNFTRTKGTAFLLYPSKSTLQTLSVAP